MAKRFGSAAAFKASLEVRLRRVAAERSTPISTLQLKDSGSSPRPSNFMLQRPIIVSNWPRWPWGVSFATANANKARWERAWPPKLQTICRPNSLFDISTIRTRLWPSG